MFIKEIVANEASIKELYHILFNYYALDGNDLIGCEPACRRPGKECAQCVEEYLKNDILWINSDNEGIRGNVFYRGTKYLWGKENTRGELIK